MNNAIVRKLSYSDRRALKHFVELERKLVGSNPLFVSELDSDVIKRLSGKSVFYRVMERQLFVVSNGHQDVARCAALINPNYQKTKNEAVGFIGFFAAAPNSTSQVQAMLEQAEVWLGERGVTRVIAPHSGAAINGGCYLLTAAFDEEPIGPFGWNPPYYADYLSASGYSPTYPIWIYRMDFSSPKYIAAQQRFDESKDKVCRVRPFGKKHWDSDVEAFGEILNEVFDNQWDFHKYTSQEYREFFAELKPLAGSFQLFIGEVDGKPVGFSMGFPDLNPLIRPLRGKLGPLQIIKIIKLLIGVRRYKRAGLMAIGVIPEYRRIDVAQALASAVYGTYRKHGLKEAFGVWVDDSNMPARMLAEYAGGIGRVLYHSYDKRLS
jgi:GNAT superfamily N-acetyltransferase